MRVFPSDLLTASQPVEIRIAAAESDVVNDPKRYLLASASLSPTVGDKRHSTRSLPVESRRPN